MLSPAPSPGSRLLAAVQATALLTSSAAPTAQSAAIGSSKPRLFFTDLESGPSTGGQDELGAFVTIYGEGFGATRGNSTVTIGGREVGRHLILDRDNAARKVGRIVVRLRHNVTSGDIVVTVDGRVSNPLAYTVRSGNIYFVIPGAANAADSNPGTFAQPFETLCREPGQVNAGDIVYVKGGRFTSADPRAPGWDCVLCLFPDIDASGTASAPVAYVGYPGDPLC